MLRLVIGCLVCLAWCGNATPGASAQIGAARAQITGGVVKLYSADPRARTISLVDGGEGMTVHEHMNVNRESHLDYGGYLDDGFTVGIQGGQNGRIVDLGTAKELSTRYAFEETVGRGQGYVSLHRENGRVVVLKNYERQTYQPVVEAGELWRADRSMSSAPVRFGHIYLVRTWDDARGFEQIVKLVVIEHVPGQSVTIRWDPI